MTTHIFYEEVCSGKIVTLDDMLSSDKHFAEPLESITLKTYDNIFLTGAVFPGSYYDAENGEFYLAEWACFAKDHGDNVFQIVWRFPIVKGSEVDNYEFLPWNDHKFIHNVYRIE